MQGTFRTAVLYPAGTGGTATTLFSTQIPEFANSDALLRLLQGKRVVIKATSPASGTSVPTTILFTFGPVLLLVALLVLMMRRSGGGMGAMSAFGRSRAQRVEPPHSMSTSRMSPASTRPRRS